MERRSEWKFFLGELQSVSAEGNIQLTLISQVSMTRVYIQPEIKNMIQQK